MITNEEIIRTIAEILAGLQVPVSLQIPLGAAREPWIRLNESLRMGIGYATAEEYEKALRDQLAEGE